ncbi:hypothetical protein [Acinetobacter sp. LoGeW2-3]|uniref:hypothetical protein n=1 Tax=Acinetobacter sp. LoGeW2-3 TaxID=1808001 RepID=UPI0012372AF8|nr:hypothetical protein [Acinetobacter sp. LoGeW2-3]
MNHREQIEIIERQVAAKGFCSNDDSKALKYHKKLQAKHPLDELMAEIKKPIIKALDWISKTLFK